MLNKRKCFFIVMFFLLCIISFKILTKFGVWDNLIFKSEKTASVGAWGNNPSEGASSKGFFRIDFRKNGSVSTTCKFTADSAIYPKFRNKGTVTLTMDCGGNADKVKVLDKYTYRDDGWAGLVVKISFDSPAHYYPLWKINDSNLWNKMTNGAGRFTVTSWDDSGLGVEKYAMTTSYHTTKVTAEAYIFINSFVIGFANNYSLSGSENSASIGVIDFLRPQETLVFNTDGGSSLSNQTKYSGETYSLPTPIKSGYTFTGWSVSSKDAGSNGSLSNGVWTFNTDPKFSESAANNVQSGFYDGNYTQMNPKVTLKANWVSNSTINVTYKFYDSATGTVLNTQEKSITCASNITYNVTSTGVSCGSTSANITQDSNFIPTSTDIKNKAITTSVHNETFRFDLKPSKITVRFIDKDTSKALIADKTYNTYYTKEYNYDPITPGGTSGISSDYKFDSSSNNTSGTVASDAITIIHYYVLKPSTITVKYLEKGTNKELAPTKTINKKYGQDYTTERIIPGDGVITNNYVYESVSGTTNGIARQDQITVIYYYSQKESSLTSSVTIDSMDPEKDLISKKDEELSYVIDYTDTVADYLGSKTVTIVATLPGKIDTDKTCILNGGIYDKDKDTITWTYNDATIDASVNDRTSNKRILITFTYADVEGTDREKKIDVESNTVLTNNNSVSNDNHTTLVKIYSKIVFHYYIDETTTSLEDDLEEIDLVGETLVPEIKNIVGYDLVEKDYPEILTYGDNDIEVSYYYVRSKCKIITKVKNDGGTITGDEVLFYGDNSTPDNIIIKVKEGYEVKGIWINNVKQDITCKKECVLSNFENIGEDKLIEVEFAFSNPYTSTINLIRIIELIPILLIIMLLYRSLKQKLYKI